jgi:16S rRNA (guanine1207-N2)-methyltransferase
VLRNPNPIAVYGLPPPDTAATPSGALQVSPLVPGAADLAALPDGGLAEMVVLAPPGVLERRLVLAHALRALAPGGSLTALARTDRGGRRLKQELVDFGCAVVETARRHHRVCVTRRPEALVGLAEAIADGGPRQLDDVGLWTQPGVFSWDRLDPGTALLLQQLPPLRGRGADLGAGIGWLARAVLAAPKVKHLTLIDLDRRAIEAARRNVVDERAAFLWADVRTETDGLSGLDFVVMNPPFHDGGIEDQRLGHAFLRAAAGMLRSQGVLWLVANRHLAYEAVLAANFAELHLIIASGGYKIHEARR